MKKYISLFALVAFMFVGVTNVSAQSAKKEPLEVTAKQKTHDLHQQLELTGKQQGMVFRLLLDNMQNAEALQTMDADVKKKQRLGKELNEVLHMKLKEVLTKEQYTQYLALEQKEK